LILYPLKGGNPVGPSLGNTSSNYFKSFSTWGDKTLTSDSLDGVQVSVPLQNRRYAGCLVRRKCFIEFLVKKFSFLVTLWEGIPSSHTSNSSLGPRFWIFGNFFFHYLFFFSFGLDPPTLE